MLDGTVVSGWMDQKWIRVWYQLAGSCAIAA